MYRFTDRTISLDTAKLLGCPFACRGDVPPFLGDPLNHVGSTPAVVYQYLPTPSGPVLHMQANKVSVVPTVAPTQVCSYVELWADIRVLYVCERMGV